MQSTIKINYEITNDKYKMIIHQLEECKKITGNHIFGWGMKKGLDKAIEIVKKYAS